MIFLQDSYFPKIFKSRVNRTFPYFYNFFTQVAAVHQCGTRQAVDNDVLLTKKNTLVYGLQLVEVLWCYKMEQSNKKSTSIDSYRKI